MYQNADAIVSNCVVIPCYNEAERLYPDQFIDFLISHPFINLLFVNDGSTDRTLDILVKMKKRLPNRIQVFDLDENSGKAEAVRKGLIEALKSGADFVSYWDADLATPLEAIDDFTRVVQQLPEISVIFGTRIPILGHRIERKLSRRIISRICALLARQVLKMPVSDTQCGAKMFRNNAALAACLIDKFKADWLFDVELFSRLTKHMKNPKDCFYEFPLLQWTEVPGSKVSGQAVVRSGMIMMRMIGEANAPQKPLTLEDRLPITQISKA